MQLYVNDKNQQRLMEQKQIDWHLKGWKQKILIWSLSMYVHLFSNEMIIRNEIMRNDKAHMYRK